MAPNRNRYNEVGGLIFIATLVISSMLSAEFVDCKAVIKTIKGDDGDVIDCVDIYKQPALKHPLLKNHTIQLKPSSYPSGIETISLQDELFQSWRRNGECPDRTIPILRNRRRFYHRVSKRLPESDGGNGHEYAQVTSESGEYYGAQGAFNVWNPTTNSGEISISQIWVVRIQDKVLSTVEAGWMNMNSGTSNRTVVFIYWTGNGYKDGCYNLQCPGFVQTSKIFTLGSPIEPISTYNGKQYELRVQIHKETASGKWWLKIGTEVMGYWPDSILPSLKGSAELVTWGGEILNSKPGGRHTSTQMGSGHFPEEGFGKASFVSNLQYSDNSGTFRDAESVEPFATYPSCYNVILKKKNPQMGTHFYFGGPGYSPTCP